MKLNYTSHIQFELDTTGVHFQSILKELILTPEQEKVFDYSDKEFYGEYDEDSFWFEFNQNLRGSNFNPFQFGLSQIIGKYEYANNKTQVKLSVSLRPPYNLLLIAGVPFFMVLAIFYWLNYNERIVFVMPLLALGIAFLSIPVIDADKNRIKQIFEDNI